MIAIGRYLLLIIYLSRLTLSVDDRFSEEDIAKFLDYIFQLHNGVRFKHKLQRLVRTDKMDTIAYQRMNVMCNGGYVLDDPYGINHNSMDFDHNTKLDGAEAIKFFSLWYEQANFYNYTIDPNDRNAVGGFTQIVWMRTKRIGLTFRCEENKYRVLAVYDPPGNQIGTYTTNVQRPLSNRRVRDPENNLLYYQTETEMFLDNILELHNKVRRKHRAKPLKRDAGLDKIASETITMTSITDYRPESLGMNSNWRVYNNNSTRLDVSEAVNFFSEWYNKGEKYIYNKEQENNDADPFTQIVWRDTKHIGMAIERNDMIYKVLVLYKPSGNIPGEYSSNVYVTGGLETKESLLESLY